ncbi:MAG TPA: diacylglycerol kinase family protein [Solirubrobacteraceae bacterium]|nr:diacylglycerol kinase family protein [Solirubrobacteraceae bacterium]
MTLALIVNPHAGGGRAGRELPRVVETLGGLNLDHHVEATRSLDHARELARAAAGTGETAVAFGGDGLIAAVADAVREADGVLGVLPGGRGNDFARALGIPLDVAQACSVLSTGTIARLDMGEVGDRRFIGIASCGFDSVANRIANETTLVRGNLVYAYGALRALAAWRPATFNVTLDGGESRFVTGFTVAVANSSYYGGGMKLAPDASLDDGMLDVVIILKMRKLRFLRLLPTVFNGAHVRQPEVQLARARTIQISSSQPYTMFADGDPIAELPVTIRVLAGAVRALVPAGGRAGAGATAAASPTAAS